VDGRAVTQESAVDKRLKIVGLTELIDGADSLADA
jgi:hypothetical protein